MHVYVCICMCAYACVYLYVCLCMCLLLIYGHSSISSDTINSQLISITSLFRDNFVTFIYIYMCVCVCVSVCECDCICKIGEHLSCKTMSLFFVEIL